MKLKLIFASLALAGLAAGCTVNLNVNDTQLLGTSETNEDRILAVLEMQQAAWNSGDIPGFMSGYWQSPDLRFASGGTVTKGWQQTLDRYTNNYKDRTTMGTLSFTNLEVSLISDGDAVVHGGWALERNGDAPSGLFTLLFREVDGEWLIVSDTTTSAD
jgi:hypothetical protein